MFFHSPSSISQESFFFPLPFVREQILPAPLELRFAVLFVQDGFREWRIGSDLLTTLLIHPFWGFKAHLPFSKSELTRAGFNAGGSCSPASWVCGWAADKYSWLKLLKPYLSLYGGAEVAFSESLGSLAAVSKSCFVAGMGQSLQKASSVHWG